MPSSPISIQRQFPLGCEFHPEQSNFRVWAPAAQHLHLVFQQMTLSCQPEADGYYSCSVKVPLGTRYAFKIDDSPDLLPDPASRFQPEGPFGWSEVVSSDFPWTDQGWLGVESKRQVFYELHIGTFTPEGTFAAATAQLSELASLGITVIELMPIADFAGNFGWGYDGVNLFAPTRLYGRPDDLRRFIDTAHSLGMGVILDVVYNHLGPTGNFLSRFAPQYFHPSKSTDWGNAINYDGEHCAQVREFYLTNAAYWIREFHFDGLRLDATQDIHDTSDPHIIAELCQAVREAAQGRHTIVTAENEPQHSELVRPRKAGGYGLDALWNDDFHHSAVVALTGRNEAYYTDYHGRAHEFVSALKHGYLFQGQHYSWQNKTRGTPALDLPPSAFMIYLQNHDQIANSTHGLRLHQLTSPARWRAMTALFLLGPNSPLLFQGQEFNAETQFLYFADHGDQLAPKIANGRADFLSQFPSTAAEDAVAALQDPSHRETFDRCKLNFKQRITNAAAYTLHKDLLRLRHTDPILSAAFDGAVLNDHALLIRFFDPVGADRLLLVNLGVDYAPNSIANPLLVPPLNTTWSVLLSTEHVRYGGSGAYHPHAAGKWRIPGEAAVLLAATEIEYPT